jgi:hypothetical protein
MTTINDNGLRIFNLLKASGFNEKFSQYITAQAAHETANFTSYIFLQNNNAFGMKFMKQASAKGEKHGYAFYTDIAGSVADYKRLWKSYGVVSLDTVESFVKFLQDQSYFEAPIEQYLAGVKYYLKLYFDYHKSGAGGSW